MNRHPAPIRPPASETGPQSGWMAGLTLADLARARFPGRLGQLLRGAHASGTGSTPGRRRGPGSELESIGPYETGDDPRLIDWSATARTGQPQVRRFLRDSEPPLIIVVDLRPSMFFGSARQVLARRACLAAAGLCSRALASDRACGLVTVGATTRALPPRIGRRARVRLLDQLVRAYHEGLDSAGTTGEPLDTGLSALASPMPRHAHWLLISDFSRPGEALRHTLAVLAPRRLEALVVEDPLVNASFVAGHYPVRPGNGRSGGLELVRVRSPRTPDAAAWRRELGRRLVRCGFASTLILSAPRAGVAS